MFTKIKRAKREGKFLIIYLGKPGKFYLICHSETEWNLAKRMEDSLNSILTPKGATMAGLTG